MTDGVRLDVWLDVACIAKTRSQAKTWCDGGKVEVNGVSAKAHRVVRVGDRIVVGGVLATRVLPVGQYTGFLRDGSDVVLLAHPVDVLLEIANA